MTKISAVGKYLDQPILTAKLSKHLPLILTGTAGGFLANKLYKTPSENRKKEGGKTAVILAGTVISAIFAPKIASKLTGRKLPPTVKEVMKSNAEIVDKFVKNNVNSDLNNILEKSKTKLLSLDEIKKLFEKNKNLADELIPPPDNIQAKDIFKEIGYLSIYGAIPVLGGIAGGVAADKIYEDNWKENIPNKVKEGVYQYLANIFLCNIGAGMALGILEKMKITSKSARCLGMIGGILATGVIGGSIIANFIGNKLINPVMSKDCKSENRRPELLDLTLHTDDIATVSLLSGLKWIEPSLPLLYSISGYRAGIGYRN